MDVLQICNFINRECSADVWSSWDNLIESTRLRNERLPPVLVPPRSCSSFWPQVIFMVSTEAPFIQPKCYHVNSKSLILNFIIALLLGLAFLIAQVRPLWSHGLSTLVYPLPSSAPTHSGLSVLRYVNTINVTILWKTVACFTVSDSEQSVLQTYFGLSSSPCTF